MSAAAIERTKSRRLDLPPAFSFVSPAGPPDAHRLACALADRDGAGTLVWAPDEDWLDLAVVLEPDEPLRGARRAFFVGMRALLDALGSAAPPEMPLAIDWPDTVRFDGARLGGGRLGWPDECAEDDAPAWLVFSATLIASKTRAGDPGLTPDSTSLEEQGLGPTEHPALVEAFARYLMLGFDTWREEGFEPVAAGYLARLSGIQGDRPRMLDEAGDLVTAGSVSGLLLPALREPAWLDPRTGTPRL